MGSFTLSNVDIPSNEFPFSPTFPFIFSPLHSFYYFYVPFHSFHTPSVLNELSLLVPPRPPATAFSSPLPFPHPPSHPHDLIFPPPSSHVLSALFHAGRLMRLARGEVCVFFFFVFVCGWWVVALFHGLRYFCFVFHFFPLFGWWWCGVFFFFEARKTY